MRRRNRRRKHRLPATCCFRYSNGTLKDMEIRETYNREIEFHLSKSRRYESSADPHTSQISYNVYRTRATMSIHLHHHIHLVHLV